ncbi:MAG TPA: pullulanase-type alpha-1,6-glucosidase [Thermoanaerobaculia bacterium]|nr:pullulanase-type alpha-1,6-glucosidase [Thermoanaerobaculia bacterium]
MISLRPFFVVLALFLSANAFAANPSSVTVAGSLQSELGCPNDWEPPCTATQLALDPEDDVWQRTFDVPAGSWEYKAALNGSWDVNYGAGGQLNGGNIALNLGAQTSVKFFYDEKTHWITSNRNATIVTAPGSYQSEVGCGGDWDPSCLRSWLQDPDGNGVYEMTLYIPAGNYEVKAAIDESWDENYGQGGVQNGANIAFSIGNGCQKTLFSYDSATHALTVSPAGAEAQPAVVGLPGSYQSEAGCAGDWDPSCATTHMAYDATDGVWQKTISIPAGNWEYKAALDNGWDENYGANAQPNGSNLNLNLGSTTNVKFYYDDATHWVADNVNKTIATVPGSFQQFLGCGGDWDPSCLRSWLQDPDGDNIYTFSTRAIPAGSYEAKVAIDESWDLNYGAGGAQNGANIGFTVTQSCAETFFVYDANSHVLTISAAGAPKGNLAKAQAYWLTGDTIAWNVPSTSTVTLHASATGELSLSAGDVQGGTSITLTYDSAGLPADIATKFPHLAGFSAFKLPEAADAGELLKGQLAVSAKLGDELVDATSLQIAGALDDLYTYEGALGITWSSGVPTIKLWAPTARSVTLRLFADSTTAAFTSHAMTSANGVWTVSGNASWNGKFYLYDVEVFTRATNTVVHNVVTDPYSVSLARNSARSHIVDLGATALKPAGWDALVKPKLDAPEDITLYELHVRDFSASDETVPAVQRGTFKAFTQSASNGMQHLTSLAAAGLTHVHLLPAFDIATVNEDKSQWQSPGDLSSYPPDSEEQQAAIEPIRDLDGFNWGYDPWHYTVPEGSYSTDADGAARVVEFREMVQSLSNSGLRTVMDVVYNHTNAAGQNDKSVLDRIVPGYYHRLNADGAVEMSSCCPNTASEHNMMEKLLIDSVLTWTRQYKVDGFRFDLMGHHMKRNMTRLRAALDALTIANDGVDGSKVYLYGEGWNFGEVANNARGENAIQANMAGTGIGTFSDRLRDGVRGGGPFDGLQAQGFGSGLYYDPNGTSQGSTQEQLDLLLLETDWIRLGLAGNLANYTFTDRNGNTITGSQLDYKGQQAGYAADPQELINYIEAHDNETLFDALALKLPVTLTMAQRVRAQNVALSVVALGQGIPFFHAGTELLRSKSLDRNSYNSGDWFNRLDFTYLSNNWGVGLPPAGDNQANWPLFQPLLANASLKPATTDIATAAQNFRELLAIRRSTRLFRLRTAADIQARVQTLTGAAPGVIVMTVSDTDGAVDRQRDLIAVAINATGVAQSHNAASLASRTLTLHPVQAAGSDATVKTSAFANGTFTVPARTTAVFVSRRPLDQQVALLKNDVTIHSLLAKLNAAIARIQDGNLHAAENQLHAFINQVQSLVSDGTIPAATGAALIAEANAIIGSM